MAPTQVLHTGESWIQKTPDVCGGDACIRDTRIPVWVLVNYRRLGGSDTDLLRDYPSLTPTELEAAWGYYAANREEITNPTPTAMKVSSRCCTSACRIS